MISVNSLVAGANQGMCGGVPFPIIQCDLPRQHLTQHLLSAAFSGFLWPSDHRQEDWAYQT